MKTMQQTQRRILFRCQGIITKPGRERREIFFVIPRSISDKGLENLRKNVLITSLEVDEKNLSFRMPFVFGVDHHQLIQTVLEIERGEGDRNKGDRIIQKTAEL